MGTRLENDGTRPGDDPRVYKLRVVEPAVLGGRERLGVCERVRRPVYGDSRRTSSRADASVQAGDDENTYVHAHFIGSSCGNVGAEAMLKAARATEHAAKDHDAQGVLDNYAKLQEEYAKAKAWFTEKYP